MKLIIFISLMFFTSIPLFAKPPQLILAKEFKGQNVEGWAMSEKLDGVRAYWDGKNLISRQGYPFTPPHHYTQNFPPYPLDGELYSGKGQFEQISATVRKHNGQWKDIKLYVFDAPEAKGNLYQRLDKVKSWIKNHPTVPIVVIPQISVRNNDHALQFLQQIEKQGGEGIMLRYPNMPYTSGRSHYLLKLKSIHDDECTVIKHYPGKGKYLNQLGALQCQNRYGKFKIGSGFKDEQRRNPPPIGSTITYQYRGFTKKGIPRFATFLRIRTDQSINQ